MTYVRVVSLLLPLLFACQRPQWLVHIATDAPLPQFGDRLLIEVPDGNGVVTSEHRLLVSAEKLRTEPLVFGVAVSAAQSQRPSSPLVRARLYREDYGGTDGQQIVPFIDALGQLPAAAPEDIEHVALTLTLSCFGVSSTLSSPEGPRTCNPSLTELDSVPTLTRISADSELTQPGSWRPGQPRPCPATVKTSVDAVCVPGGALVLSGPVPFLSRQDPPRLTVVAPFLIDRDELTVQQLTALTGKPLFVPPADSACTFAGTAADFQNLKPVNCVSYALARAVCAARTVTVNGVVIPMRLPTGAEIEWAAGNLAQETLYPWGNDPDVCEHAIVARAALSGETTAPIAAQSGFSSCRWSAQQSQPWGPQVGGHPGSSTQLGIRNLTGSLSEPTSDGNTKSYAGSCWTPPTGRSWLDNPSCPADETVSPSFRGGNWKGAPYSASAIYASGNYAYSPDSGVDFIGIRCVAPLHPLIDGTALPSPTVVASEHNRAVERLQAVFADWAQRGAFLAPYGEAALAPQELQ